MKKYQIYGVVAICLGVLVMGFMKLPFVEVANSSASWGGFITGTLWRFSIFDMLDNFYMMPPLFIATAILGIVTYVLAIALIIFGIILLVDKWNDKLLKLYKPIIVSFSLVLILTGVLAIAFACTYELGIEDGWQTLSGGWGIGSVLFIVLGILSILQIWTRRITRYLILPVVALFIKLVKPKPWPHCEENAKGEIE